MLGEKAKLLGKGARKNSRVTFEAVSHLTTRARATNETKRFPSWANTPQPLIRPCLAQPYTCPIGRNLAWLNNALVQT